MQDSKTDLVMRFVLGNGEPVLAECLLDVWKNDTLMKDFKSAGQNHFSNFFEVSSFDLSIALKETDKKKSTLKSKNDPLNTQQKSGEKAAPSGAFAAWRSATKDELKKIYYPLELDKFSFKRNIDCASPVFFQSCCKSETFASAVLVKRRSQGGTDVDGGLLPSAGYLRIEFTKVLITGIDWDDGEVVEEKCEFICRGITVTYRQQKDDGTIDASTGLQPVEWNNDRVARNLANRGRR